MKKAVSVFLSLVLLLSLCACSQKAVERADTVEAYLIENADDMFSFGNLFFDMAADELLQHFELGDIVTVTVDGCEPLDIPVCASYDDVSAGELLLRAVSGKDSFCIAINYGQIGMVLGILEETGEDSGNRYALKSDAKLPLKVTITLKEEGGYKDRLALSYLVRPDDREEYAAPLTDEQFANFRAVSTSGMGENVLYRSSSPIDDTLGRSAVADALAEKAGIRTFIDLADHEARAKDFPSYAESYYARQNAVFLALPASFTTEAFSEGLADGLRYMAAHEGPYLLHCLEGKDRAGFTAAVLELLMGASLEEVQADYLLTYENYFAPLKNGGEQLSDKLRETICAIIVKNLEYAYEVDDLGKTDTQKATEDYLLHIGLNTGEIAALKSCLSEK